MPRTGNYMPMVGLQSGTNYHVVTMPPSPPVAATPLTIWERMRCCVSDRTGDTGLITAIEEDRYDDCKKLLEDDKKIINVQEKDTKQTALHYAAKEGKLQYVELLLDYNANCNAQDSKGNTPLHLAIENGHQNCSEKILNCNNLQISLGNVAQDTPLHLAAKKSNMYIVDMLLNKLSDYDDTHALDDLGNTLLHLATAGGHLDTCDKLLQLNAKEINSRNNDNNTPLHLAAKEGNCDIVDLLHKYNANCNLKNHSGNTPLHEAVVGGHCSCVTKLLEFDNLEIDLSNNDNSTSLHCAVKAGNSEMVGELLNHGANCNAQDKAGDTPLHLAVTGNHFDCFTKLLEFDNLEFDLPNNNIFTSLHCAAIEGNSEMVEQLLDQGANCNAQDKSGDTPLHLAVTTGHQECCETLLRCSSLKINEKNKIKDSPLHVAAKKGHRSVCDLILQHSGVKINIKNKVNRTPLHLAAQENNHEVIKLLLDKGADWKLRDKRAYMPLHYAAENGSVNSCEHLTNALRNDASADTLKLTLRDKKTPLMLAAKGGFHHCCEKLPLENINEKDRYGNTALFYAVEDDFEKTVIFLLDNGADITLKNAAERTVLHHAAKNKVDKCLSYLLNSAEAGDLLQVKDKDNGYTPIHEAISSEALTCAMMLLEHDASITAKSNGGMTPLHLAAKYGDPGICSLLVSSDEIDANEVNDRQETPLHLAAMHGCKDACRVLLRKGTRVLSQDEDGRTALHLAAERGHEHVLSILIKKGVSPYIKDKSDSTALHLAATKGHLRCCQVLVANAKNLLQEEDGEHNLAMDNAFKNQHDEVFAFLIGKLKPKTEIPPNLQSTQPRKLSEYEKRMKCLHKYMHQSLTPQNPLSPPRIIVAEAIIESGWWRAACFSGTDRDAKSQLCGNFQELINNYPSLALKIQDRWFQHSSPHDFRLFEDNYCHEAGPETLEKQHTVTDGERLLQNHPVSLMVQNTRVKMLQHSSTDAWLMHLWRTYIAYIFTFLLIIEVLFLIALHVFMDSVDNWSRIQHQCNTDKEQFCGQEPNAASDIIEGSVDGLIASDVGSSRCDKIPSSWVPLPWIFLLVMTVSILLLEGIYIYRLRKQYLRIKRLLRTLQLSFTIVLMVPIGVCGYLHPVIHTWQWQCGIVALLMEWILFIEKLNQLPVLFVFMPITKHFLFIYVKALGYVLSLLFVFSYIFHLVLADEPAFSSIPQSMMKMITWVLGDLNYEDTFVKDDMVYPYMGQPMFVAFIIIMGGFIANLAIGQPSDRVNQYKKDARYFQVEAQSNLFLEIKACFPRLQKIIIEHSKTSENRKTNFADIMANRLFKPSITNEKTISQDTTLESIESQVAALINLCIEQKKELKDLKQQVNVLLKRTPKADLYY